jgi:hypothetical protein
MKKKPSGEKQKTSTMPVRCDYCGNVFDPKKSGVESFCSVYCKSEAEQAIHEWHADGSSSVCDFYDD